MPSAARVSAGVFAVLTHPVCVRRGAAGGAVSRVAVQKRVRESAGAILPGSGLPWRQSLREGPGVGVSVEEERRPA